MAPDPSAVHAMKEYGNWELVKSDRGEFGVVRDHEGNLHEAWSLFRRDRGLEPNKHDWLTGVGDGLAIGDDDVR